MPDEHPTAVSDDVYTLYTDALARLDARDATGALELLVRAVEREPEAENVREALGRAQFDAKLFSAARASFAAITVSHPDNDYAWFGLGLSEQRLQMFGDAAEHLALAAVMRPERADYRTALADVRATLRFRRERGLGGSGEPGGPGGPGELPGEVERR